MRSATTGEDVHVDLTFNPGAIPVAVLLILFGTAQYVFRERVTTVLKKWRLDAYRRTPARYRDRVAAFGVLWCLALAAFALFYKFD